MDDVAINSENKKDYMLGGVTGKGFMPGISGNPSGRPKGTMKEYLKRKFTELSDAEKEEFLKQHKVTGKDQIEFGEGKARQDVELHATMTISDVLNKLDGFTPEGQTMENEPPVQNQG